MTENHILLKMTDEKQKKLKEFIRRFLGHEPTKQERKEFTIMNGLSESKIYHQGIFVGSLKFDIDDDLIM